MRFPSNAIVYTVDQLFKKSMVCREPLYKGRGDEDDAFSLRRLAGVFPRVDVTNQFSGLDSRSIEVRAAM